jgi:hypothetical protein
MQKGKNLMLKYGFVQDIGYVKSPQVGIAKVWQDRRSTSLSDQLHFIFILEFRDVVLSRGMQH